MISGERSSVIRTKMAFGQWTAPAPDAISPHHERSLRYNIARNGEGRPGHRASSRAYLRARPIRAERLSLARACRSSARSVFHGADRHAAGRLGAAIADLHRRYAGPDARAVDGRTTIPQPRRRTHAARSVAARCDGEGTSPRDFGWRRSLL